MVFLGCGGAAGLALTVFVARTLPVHDAGYYFESAAAVTILTATFVFGADIGIIKVLSIKHADGRHIHPVMRVASIVPVLFSVLLCIGLAITVVVAPGFLAGGRLVFVALLVVPPLCAMRLSNAARRAVEGSRKTALYEGLAVPAVRLGLVATFAAVFGVHLLVIIAGWTVATLAVSAWPASLWVREAISSLPINRAEVVTFWTFAAPRGVAATLQVNAAWIQVLIVGALAGPAIAGKYGALSRLSIVGTLLLQAIAWAYEPVMARLFEQGSTDNLIGLYRRVTVLATAVGLPAYVLFIGRPSDWIRVFGRQLHGTEWALVIISTGMLVNVVTGPATVALLMSGRSAANLANTATSLVIQVILSVILIPRLGINGAAIAWATSIALDHILPVIQLRRALPVWPWSRIWTLLAGWAILCFGVVPQALMRALPASSATYPASVVAAGLLYLAAIYAFRDPGTSALRRLSTF